MNTGSYGHHNKIYTLGKEGNLECNDDLSNHGNHHNEGNHRNHRKHDSINSQKINYTLKQADFAQL